MARFGLALPVLVLALVFGSAATFAGTRGGKVDNVASTRAYLLARHRFELATRREPRLGEAAARSLVATVTHGCSGVLVEAPESRARSNIRAEIAEDVALTVERNARHATLAFARTVRRLRWSNRELTYLARHSAREEAAKELVALPDICSDAKAFAANGFTVAPATTEKFLARCDAANSITTIEARAGESGDLEERIWRLLKPYERRDEKALIPRKPTKREIEQETVIFDNAFGRPVVEIAHALGLPE